MQERASEGKRKREKERASEEEKREIKIVYVRMCAYFACLCVCACVCDERGGKKRGEERSRCERCLLITESPKTPGHYRYLIWVLCYIPYTGLI